MSEEPEVRCDDESTWRHKGEKIDLPRLLELIEENGGPAGLDLHGCDMEEIEGGPEALRPYAVHYRKEHGRDAEVPWLRAHWNPGVSLGEAHLERAYVGQAHLENADLGFAHLEKADLADAHLEGANLSYACLKNATLWKAHLENADLRDADLENAYLMRAHLENADLEGTHLENASLWQAHLENAHLMRAHLENADLWGARLDGAFWYGCYLERTRVRRESVGDAIGDELQARGRASRRRLYEFQPVTFHHAREAYLGLKTHFDSIGRYDDASWAYVKEQQMEKAIHFPTTAGHEWVRERMGSAVPPAWWGPGGLPGWVWWKLRSAFYHCRVFVAVCPGDLRRRMARRDEEGNEREEWLSRWRWARNWAFELLTGYGERVYMPVLWAVVVVAVFTGIYAAAGNVAAGDVGALQGQPTHSPVTALVHSVSAFATIGFNTLEPQGLGARLLTAIEAMFGIGLFALFVFTLGNRMRRS